MDDPRPIVCVDLNGVLDAYTGWRGPEHWDPPRAGAEEFLRALNDRGYRVVLFTTRYAADAHAWLAAHGLSRYVAEVTDRKLAAHVFVDDRAVCFQGDFAATLEQVVRFAAHWEIPAVEEGLEIQPRPATIPSPSKRARTRPP
jgi:hypothetical protein